MDRTTDGRTERRPSSAIAIDSSRGNLEDPLTNARSVPFLIRITLLVVLPLSRRPSWLSLSMFYGEEAEGGREYDDKNQSITLLVSIPERKSCDTICRSCAICLEMTHPAAEEQENGEE